MTVKFLEIRDSATFIPAVAFRLRPEHPRERYLAARAGFFQSQEQAIWLLKLVTMEAGCHENCWDGSRTMKEAHKWIKANWKDVVTEDVIDVQFILGETDSKAMSEYYGMRS